MSGWTDAGRGLNGLKKKNLILRMRIDFEGNIRHIEFPQESASLLAASGGEGPDNQWSYLGIFFIYSLVVTPNNVSEPRKVQGTARNHDGLAKDKGNCWGGRGVARERS